MPGLMSDRVKGIIDGHEARVRELQAQLQTVVQKGDALASDKAQLAARAQDAAAAAAQLEEKVGRPSCCMCASIGL